MMVNSPMLSASLICLGRCVAAALAPSPSPYSAHRRKGRGRRLLCDGLEPRTAARPHGFHERCAALTVRVVARGLARLRPRGAAVLGLVQLQDAAAALRVRVALLPGILVRASARVGWGRGAGGDLALRLVLAVLQPAHEADGAAHQRDGACAHGRWLPRTVQLAVGMGGWGEGRTDRCRA